MISDTFHRILNHFPDHAHAIPFLIASTRFDDPDSPSIRVDTKTLVTALIVALVTGLAAAAWATYSTTKELSLQFGYLSRQIADTSVKVEQISANATAERIAMLERLTRIETMAGMQGNKK